LENKLEPAWGHALERVCREKIRTLEEEVSDGRAEDYAAYRYLCGQIRGIHFAIDALIGLQERPNPEEEQWRNV
jgi:hypothetical protein